MCKKTSSDTSSGFFHLETPEVLSREPYGHAADWWSLGVLVCRMLTNEYPTPAVGARAMKGSKEDLTNGDTLETCSATDNPPPGTLPASSSSLSAAARGLLLRLLDRDPRVRMRNLRQLEQSAFFMGFKMQKIREKQLSPKLVLEECLPDGASNTSPADQSLANNVFESFDQALVL